MYFKVAKTINFLVVVLMSLEILGASLAVLPSASDSRLAIHSHKAPSSILGSFLFEKTEEENEGSEKENGSISRALLLDFSSAARSLSAFHSPDFHVVAHAFQYDVRPPVHQLNCVFLI
jgi:hypothetical protein